MSGIFSTFNTANKGLQVQQAALHTTGHNISNANTAGYSRQRVDTKADLAYNYIGVGQLGTGVKIDGVVRLVDDYVSKQIRQENSVFNMYNTKSDVLGQVEIIFNEPSDTGINANLGQMFDSWQELSKNPESLTQKTIVVEKSNTLAKSLNHMSDQLNNLKSNTVEDIGKNVKDFNATVDKLDSLNKQIFNVAIKGQVPNDLLDQRDMLLNDLSGIADVKVGFDDYGRAEIKLGGEGVLVGADRKYLDIETGGDATPGINLVTYEKDENGKIKIDATTKEPIVVGNKLPIKINSGQVAGNIEGLKEIKERLLELDKFANMMGNAINKAHGTDIFVKAAEAREDGIVEATGITGTAGMIKVRDEILFDSSKIIAGKYPTSVPDDSPTSPSGDGTRALDIAGLRSKKIEGNTIEGSYINIVTEVGISKEYSDNMVKNQEVLLDHLVLRRESTSGVNIDEEVTNVVRFQKAYQANAKVISVLTDMLDTIINRMGV